MLMRMPTSNRTDSMFNSRIFSHPRNISASRIDRGGGSFFDDIAVTHVPFFIDVWAHHRFEGGFESVTKVIESHWGCPLAEPAADYDVRHRTRARSAVRCSCVIVSDLSNEEWYR